MGTAWLGCWFLLLLLACSFVSEARQQGGGQGAQQGGGQGGPGQRGGGPQPQGQGGPGQRGGGPLGGQGARGGPQGLGGPGQRGGGPLGGQGGPGGGPLGGRGPLGGLGGPGQLGGGPLGGGPRGGLLGGPLGLPPPPAGPAAVARAALTATTEVPILQGTQPSLNVIGPEQVTQQLVVTGSLVLSATGQLSLQSGSQLTVAGPTTVNGQLSVSSTATVSLSSVALSPSSSLVVVMEPGPQLVGPSPRTATIMLFRSLSGAFGSVSAVSASPCEQAGPVTVSTVGSTMLASVVMTPVDCSSGLSTGQIVGIALGVLVAAAALVLLGRFLYKRRLQGRDQSENLTFLHQQTENIRQTPYNELK